MSKICLQCGYENDENAKFCIRCGKPFSAPAKGDAEPGVSAPANLSSDAGVDAEKDANEKRIRAEWQGSDCHCAIDGGTSGNFSSDGPYRLPPYGAPAGTPPYSAAYYEAQRREWKEKAIREAAINKRKTLFILAFVGLLLDIFAGIGALMCLPVAIIASVDFSALYKTEKKMSSQLLWAMIVGYVGAVIGVVFFILIF